MPHTFPKSEKLCGATAVASLVRRGKWLSTAHLRCCRAGRDDDGPVRVVVSVPKKLFKRAVKRNLLKRRMRESYRLQKHLLPSGGLDLMLCYSSAELQDFSVIYAEVGELLAKIAR